MALWYNPSIWLANSKADKHLVPPLIVNRCPLRFEAQKGIRSPLAVHTGVRFAVLATSANLREIALLLQPQSSQDQVPNFDNK